ncbi:hypothetical protein RD792_010129 [Penstemon davidsonii]|uniref:Myb-like domain-containing protein n=1 Tax=Penstemon davidsonii TaxID=160366 RepID=A0ABR0D101_9LAMI|nr:hypothetical protein RD792_010129 [Penstemon davidsonii]
MGGVVEGGVGIVNKTSPRRAAIEKCMIHFWLQGGNPLDFKFRNAASLSVQSTSFTNQHPDQFVAGEAKGSFPFNASPHGDSVESSGRPGELPSEPNSADNLFLLDAEREFSEGDRNSLHPNSSNILPSEQSSQMGGSHKAREHGNSAAFGLPRKAYKRRNRSRPNQDVTRSSSNDVNPNCGNHGSSLPSRHSPRDVKGLVSDAENQNIQSYQNFKPTSPIEGALHKTVLTDGQHDMELDGSNAIESTKDPIEGISAPDAICSEIPLDEQLNPQPLLGAAKIPIEMDSGGPEAIRATEEMNSAVIECQPSFTATKAENQSGSCQMNGFSRKKGEGMSNVARNINASRGMKGLDSESTCTQTNLNVDGNNDSELCTKMRNLDSNGTIKNQNLVSDKNPIIEGGESIKEKKEIEGIDSDTLVNLESVSASQNQLENRFTLQPEEELQQSEYALKTEVKDYSIIKGVEDCGPAGSVSERKPTEPLDQTPAPQNEISCDFRHNDSIDTTISDLHDAASLSRVSTVFVEAQTSVSDSKLTDKVDEDSVLKEAQIIEAKRKRIAELSMSTYATEIRQKSHWNYVLEEMAWLANDFAQERIWKIVSAAQICNQAAFTCQLRKHGKHSGTAVKEVAHALAKAVMEFWHSVEERSKELEQQGQKDGAVSVQAYAVRFLKYNNSHIFHDQAVVPLTPDRISDSGILDLSWKDNLTEVRIINEYHDEILFYTIPPGAMETYRKSIESHVAQRERFGSIAQEEVETSACDAAIDFEYQDNAYGEDDGETSTYDMSVAYEGSRSSRFGQKKRKHLTHAYGPRSYEIGSDLLPMQCTGNIVVTQHSSLLAKRPENSLNASIPTKRVRTASRRVISPFSAGTSGCIQVPKQTDASSGDTNSFQDDQSTLHGGSLVPNNLDIESTGDFEKQLQFESVEVSTRPKKKKKAKHLNAAYEQRWQVDSSFQHEQLQRDHFRKRPESHQLESNGSSGLLGHPMTKKPKIIRQSQDNSFDNITPISGSGPSPVASQMSNMSNPNKFIKMLGGRDRGRKPKALKMPAGQPGSGTAWSLFEDQALVVLAHDLGPNWELVSDAINSTLHFKCIFRKAKECKERHNFLMDRTSVDGADSAEDSGSSQPYPSTLPGIPKGSARQLFQRLQGPMEEDTLKSHFEKIITIGQKQHYRKTQDPKQLQPPHNSHTIALSEACPNNLGGGPILTPLDLCDATIPGPDILSLGYQGPHSSGLANPNQGAVTPLLSASSSSSTLQGSANMMLGNNFPSSPGPLNSSVR